MRCYGNVKGRKYYAEQPTPEAKQKKVLCPECRKWKQEKEFKIGNEYRVLCRTCREGKSNETR